MEINAVSLFYVGAGVVVGVAAVEVEAEVGVVFVHTSHVYTHRTVRSRLVSRTYTRE